MPENHQDYLSLITPKTLSYEDCKAQAESILESISDGVFTINSHWLITFFNQAAEKITGIPRRLALGKPCYEIFRSNMCNNNCALRQTMSTGTPLINLPAYILDGSVEREILYKFYKDKKGEWFIYDIKIEGVSMVQSYRAEFKSQLHQGTVTDLIEKLRKERPVE